VRYSPAPGLSHCGVGRPYRRDGPLRAPQGRESSSDAAPFWCAAPGARVPQGRDVERELRVHVLTGGAICAVECEVSVRVQGGPPHEHSATRVQFQGIDELIQSTSLPIAPSFLGIPSARQMQPVWVRRSLVSAGVIGPERPRRPEVLTRRTLHAALPGRSGGRGASGASLAGVVVSSARRGAPRLTTVNVAAAPVLQPPGDAPETLTGAMLRVRSGPTRRLPTPRSHRSGGGSRPVRYPYMEQAGPPARLRDGTAYPHVGEPRGGRGLSAARRRAGASSDRRQSSGRPVGSWSAAHKCGRGASPSGPRPAWWSAPPFVALGGALAVRAERRHSPYPGAAPRDLVGPGLGTRRA
jgi:hypothetical protein